MGKAKWRIILIGQPWTINPFVGDKSNAHEGCYFKSKTISRSVLEQHLHSPKKGWREQTSYKSETSKQLHSLPPFQNRGVIFSKIASFAKRLDVQSRFEGCLLLYSYPSKFTEIVTFRMGRFFLSICQSLFWSITCTTNIHKIIKNPNDPIKEVRNKTHHLFRRYPFDGFLKSGSGDCQGYIDFSITTSGIRNQCEKISLNPSKKR